MEIIEKSNNIIKEKNRKEGENLNFIKGIIDIKDNLWVNSK